MQKFILIAFSLCIFQSCKLFLKTTGHYKTPQPETIQSIKDYIGKDIQYDGLYRAKSDTGIKYFTDSVGRSIPFVYVFDQKMRNIYKSKTCAWNNDAQLDSLKLADDWKINESINYTKFSKYLILADGEQLAAGYDYAVFFVWAKFVPKLSREILVQMSNQSKASKEKLYIGCVNLDFYNP